MKLDNILIIISGPSGSGKSTICDDIIKRNKSILYSISHTTRNRRGDEIDGVDYNFVSENEFGRMIGDGEFVEWALVHGNYYGTSFKSIESNKNTIVLLIIDVQGAKQLISKYGADSITSIFIDAPSIDDLELRLIERDTDSIETINKRLKNSKIEMESKELFRFHVINDNLEIAINDVEKIVINTTTL